RTDLLKGEREHLRDLSERLSWPSGLKDDKFSARAWFDEADRRDTKRRNPLILPVDSVVKEYGPKKEIVRQMQWHYVHGGVGACGREGKNVGVFKGRGAVGGVLQPATPEGIGAGAAAPPFAYRIYPARLLVVTATFPYKEQMELYQKALRFE